MSMSSPVYRATVTYSNSSTGQITVRIPSLAGADSTFDISYIGRAVIDGVWAVPAIGEQIVVTADDPNFTNTFWVQTNQVRGPQGVAGTNGADGSWSLAQTLRSVTGTTDGPTYADRGKLVIINTSSGDVNVYITGVLTLNIGERIDFAWMGTASSVTFVESGSVLRATPGYKLRARYSSASLICVENNTYLLVGDLSA